MWKRLQNRDKEKQIGNPVLIDTTADEKLIGRARNISDLQNEDAYPTTSARQAPVRRKADKNAEGLPELPFKSLPSYNHPRDNRLSEAPTASSIYSQPTPEMDHDWPQQAVYAPAQPRYADISPPSSPELRAEDRPYGPTRSRSVSPIEQFPSGLGIQSKSAPRQASHIPVLRKSPPTKWDDLSGEPTTSASGKTAQVLPGSDIYHRFSMTKPLDGQFGNQTNISASSRPQKSKKSLFGERAARFGAKALSIETKPREPWRGASGRQTLVPPVADKPTATPLAIPPRHKRPVPGFLSADIEESSRSTPSSAAVTVRMVPTVAETLSVSAHQKRDEMYEEPIKPIVPLKAGRNSPPRSIASPTSPNNPAHPYPSPTTPTPKTQTQHATSISEVSSSQQSRPNAYPPGPREQPRIHRKSIDTVASSHTAHKDEGPPTSRFSWSTHATHTTYQHSPPPSPPPMPVATLAQQAPIPAPLSHQRPLQSVVNTPSPATRRNTIPPANSPFTPQGHVTSTARTPTSAIKALPRPPTETTSTDLISSLNAQLTDLSLRRSNLSYLLTDLSKQTAAAQNPIIVNVAQRREMERKQKEVEDEISEIKAEEHEIGLRLHRAYRRRERDGGFEGTSAIWVRRVTE